MKKPRQLLQKILDWFDSATKSDSGLTDGLGQSEHETTIRFLIKCITACVICVIFVIPIFLLFLLVMYAGLIFVLLSDSTRAVISNFFTAGNRGSMVRYLPALLLPLAYSFRYVLRWLDRPDHAAPAATALSTTRPPRKSLQQVFADFCSDILSLGPDVTERYDNNHVVFSRGKRLLCRVSVPEANRTIFVFLNEPLNVAHPLELFTDIPRIDDRAPDIIARTQRELDRALFYISESYFGC